MFKASISGLNGFKAQFASASDNLEKIVDGELETMSQEWVRLAKIDAPADIGGAGLKGAISFYKVAPLKYEIVAQKFYAPFMEFGTKGKYQPIPGTEQIAAQSKAYKGSGGIFKAIKLWVGRKGIGATFTKSGKPSKSKSSLSAQESAAFLIARSILRNGVKPHPFFFKQMHIVWPKFLQATVRRINNSKLEGSGTPKIQNV